MDDVAIPNFAERIRKGEIFFNDMQKRRQESNAGSGIGHATRSVGTTCTSPVLYREYRRDGHHLPSLVTESLQAIPVEGAISASEIASLQTEVSTRCLSARGSQGSNRFESLAQAAKTIAMLKRPFSAIDSFFRKTKVKITRSGRRRKNLMRPVDAWLTYRYGLKPLINDVDEILRGLDKGVGNQKYTTRANGFKTRTSTRVFTKDLGINRVHIQAMSTCSVTVRAMSLDEYVSDLLNNIGFDIKGALTVSWELVPYSFVIDWFANVGDYLRAFIPTPSVVTLGNCLTTEVDSRTDYSVLRNEHLDPANSYFTRELSGTCSARIYSKSRTPLQPAGLVLKSDFRLDDQTRMADYLSLIAAKGSRMFK
jgi:hypothetical protein